jgi:putative phosphoribosyl transferase
LRRKVDDVIWAFPPGLFPPFGIWYEDFPETSDDEVRELLTRNAEDRRAA